MADESADQLAIQQQINEVLEARKAILKEMEASYSRQSKVSASLCSAMDQCRVSADKTRQSSQQLRNGLEQAAQEAENLSDELEGAQEEAESASDSIQSASGGIGSFVKAGLGLAGVASVFGKIGGMAEGLGAILSSVTSAIWNIGTAIIAIPFQIFGALVDMAQGGGGSSGLREAIESVREQFGDLASNEGKALYNTLGDMRKNMRNLAGTGLRMGKVFGYGRKGMAELLKANLELAQALGPSFNKLKGVIEKNSVAIAMYGKGLGLAAEQQAYMLKHAKAMGKDPVKYLNAVANQAIQLGKQFGISSKVMGKAVGEMTADVDNFGHMSVKQLGATAAFASKLGIEIKTLSGIVDKFLNFEDAAQSVAQLNQAFGAQVDVMKLMNAESPAQQIDMMRKSMFAAGKDIRSMTLAERKLLAQTTGLQGAALEQAFSIENQGVSYDKMAEASEKAAKAQKSQAEVMKELSKNIKRLVRSGGGGKVKGFFDAFSKGFEEGIMRAGPFRQMLRNIARSLRITTYAGRAVGRMFVNMFPGIKKMTGGLADIFDPKRFQKFMDKIKGVFRTFFTDVGGNKPGSVKNFLKSLKDTFMNWLSGGKAGGGKILEGLSEFWNAFKLIIKQAIPVVVEGLVWLFDQIAAFINNPSVLVGPMNAIGNFFGNLFDEFYSVIEPHVSKIGDAFMKLVQALEPYFVQVYDWIGTKMSELGTVLWDAITNSWVAKAAIGAAIVIVGAKLLGVVGAVLGTVFSGIGGIIGKIKGQGAGSSFIDFLTEFEDVEYSDIAKFAALLVVVGVAMAGLTHAVVIPTIEAISASKGLTPQAAAGYGIIMGASLLGVIGVLEIAKRYQALMENQGFLKKIGIGLAIIAGIMLIMGGVFALNTFMLVKAMGDKDAGGVGKVFKALSSMLQAVLIMMPVAAVLGIAAAASPWGTLGVALIVLGMGVIGTLLVALTYCLIPAIKMIAGMDVGNPAEFEKKMRAFVSIIQAFQPILEMNKGFEKIEDADPEQIIKMIQENNAGVTGVLKEMRLFINDLISAVGGMTPAQMESAKVGGKIISSVSSLLGVLIQPFGQLITSLEKLADEDIDDFSEKLAPAFRNFRIQMVAMVKQLAEPLRDLIKTIYDVDIDMSDADKAKNKMNLITLAARAAGDMMKGFTAMTEGIGANKALQHALDESSYTSAEKFFNKEAVRGGKVVREGGQVTKTKLGRVMRGVDSVMSKITGSIGKHMPTILTKVSGLYTTLKTSFAGESDASILKKLELVTAAIGIAGKFSKVLGETMQSLGGGSGALSKAISEGTISTLLLAVTEITNVLSSDLVLNLGLMVSGISAIDIPETMNDAKIKSLGSIMGIATSFATIMKDIQDKFGEKEVQIDKGKFKTIGASFGVMGTIVTEMKQPLSDLVENMIGKDGKGGLIGKIPAKFQRGVIAAKVKTLGFIAQAAKSFTGIIGGMVGDDGTSSIFGTVAVATGTSLSWIIALMDKGMAKANGIPMTIPEFTQHMANKKNKLYAIGSKTIAAMDDIPVFMNAFSSAMPAVQKAGEVAILNHASSIASIAEQINTMNASLRSIKAGSIDVALQNFTKAVAVGGNDKSFKVKPANMTVNMTINIKMDRHSMVKYLSGKVNSKTTDRLKIADKPNKDPK
tara:strand:+ start:20503 stop:25413 length:4911 start_codon:yes stop_codon:yes gene_type:complete